MEALDHTKRSVCLKAELGGPFQGKGVYFKQTHSNAVKWWIMVPYFHTFTHLRSHLMKQVCFKVCNFLKVRRIFGHPSNSNVEKVFQMLSDSLTVTLFEAHWALQSSLGGSFHYPSAGLLICFLQVTSSINPPYPLFYLDSEKKDPKQLELLCPHIAMS